MSKPSTNHSSNLFFENISLLSDLYGEEDAHLRMMERLLRIETIPRGNMLSITGAQRDVILAESILMEFYRKAEKGTSFSTRDIEAALNHAPPVLEASNDVNYAPKQRKKAQRKAIASDVYIKTLKKTIEPYTHMQANYMRALYDHDLVFALGPAGTGKTYIAMAMAISMYLNKKVERIVLCRPAVEAGEKLGFLPGDMKEKIDPYLRPLYDAIFDMLPAPQVNDMIARGEIEVAPLAFMRGRTLSNAFVVLDEAQNTTSTQMKMFLTRLGENSRMVITGDLSQIDLPKDIKSGLHDSLRKISHIEGIGVIYFADADVVRHELAAKIVEAYNQWDAGVRPKRITTDKHGQPIDKSTFFDDEEERT